MSSLKHLTVVILAGIIPALLVSALLIESMHILSSTAVSSFKQILTELAQEKLEDILDEKKSVIDLQLGKIMYIGTSMAGFYADIIQEGCQKPVNLTKTPEGAYTNGERTIYIPNFVELNDEVMEEVCRNEAVTRVLKRFTESESGIALAYIYSERGVLHVYPPINISMLGGEFDATKRPWYIAAVEAGEPTWSPVYWDVTGKGWMTTFVVPIYVNGTLIGVLGFDVTLEHLEKLARIELLNETKIALIGNGNPIFDTGIPDNDPKIGIEEVGDYIIISKRLNTTGWTYCVGIKKKDIQMPVAGVIEEQIDIAVALIWQAIFILLISLFIISMVQIIIYQRLMR